MIQQGQFRSPEVRRRFQNEAETAARLRHPNLVAIHEVGEHKGIPFFSMEYVKGRTLADLARQGRIRPRVVAQLTQTIAETIQYIHSCGVLHRDLKPSNVMLDQNSDVRITDFGLAKQLDRDYSLTETGQILGSIDYMPPEQAEARHEQMGPASDVYSIGAILYELLAGRPPFRSESFLETLRQIREEDPTPISELNVRVPRALEAICLKCLRKKPKQRYQSAEELSLDLQRFLEGEPVRVDSRWKLSTLWRSRWFHAAGGTTLAMFSAGLLCWALFSKPQSEAVAGTMPRSEETTALPRNEAPAVVKPDEQPQLAGPLKPQNAPEVNPQVSPVKVDSEPSEQAVPQPEVKTASNVSVSPPLETVAGNGTSPPIETVASSQVLQADPPTELAAKEKDVEPVLKDAYSLPAIRAIGFPGEPFGIAHVELEVSEDCNWTWQPDKPLRLKVETGKALYASFHWIDRMAAYRDRPARPARVKIWYLFDGNTPAPVTVISGDDVLARNVTISTDEVNVNRSRLLTEWINYFSRTALQHRSPEIQSVKRYFDTMLARRMKLDTPFQGAVRAASGLEVEFERTFGMLFGFESIRLAMMADKVPSASDVREVATEPLPAPLTIPSVRIPGWKRQEAQHCEAIATRVPQECFYLRCFRVENYGWVRSLVRGWGGDIDGVVANPAADYRVRDRIESQLGLSMESLLAEGIDKEITDCALIGLDPFFHDGAAVGVLFEEKPGSRLGDLLKISRRKTAIEAGITESTAVMKTATLQVLQTLRNEIRSYYITSGRYHLITNSSMLAVRFHQTEHDRTSLGNLLEYTHARSQVQNEGECAGWLYLSDPFFRNITSPKYRIELQRRRQAKDDLVALHLARVASEAETGSILETSELIREGFLPEQFGLRPDDTAPMQSDGVVCDSRRGVPGSFVPLADMDVLKCTAFEAECYEEFKQAYQREWRTMDPVLLTFHRSPSQVANREKVVLHIHITPYAQQEYAFLRQNLSRAADSQRIAPNENELLGISARLQSQSVHPWAAAGLIDEDVPFQLKDGEIVRTGQNNHQQFSKSNAYALITEPDESSAYLLANFVSCLKSRKPLDINNGGQQTSFLGAVIESIFPVRQIIRTAISDYSMIEGETRVLSVNKPLASEVLRGYRLEDAPRPAHLFMHLEDISGAKVYPYINAWTYMSSRQASAADVSTINLIADALQADPKIIFEKIETSLGADLKCPVGGEYSVHQTMNRPPFIVSTAWNRPWLREENEVPASYEFPFLKWLHGLNLECTLGAVTLESRLELDIEAGADAQFEPIRELTMKNKR
jgi:serine/threonine protein kinase